MATNLTQLRVSLTVATGAFSKGLKSAADAAEGFGNSLKSALLGPLGAISGALSAGAIAAGAAKAAASIDAMAKSADQLGISVQSLSGLRYAAESSGVSAEQLEKAMTKLSDKVQEASTGNKTAADSLAGLGLKLSDLASKRPDEQMQMVADAVAGMGSSAERSAALVKVFGEEGAKLAPALSGGAAQMEAAAKEAEKFGLVLNRVDAAKVEEANLSFKKVGAVFEGIFNRIAVELAPFITALSNAFADSAASANGFGDIIRWAVDMAVEGAALIADGWWRLRIVFKTAQIAASYIGDGLFALADGGARAAEWIGVKFSQAWDVVKTSAQTLWNALKVGWYAIRVPISDFFVFVNSGYAELLEISGNAISLIDSELGDSLNRTAAKMRANSRSFGEASRIELAKATKELQESAGRAGESFSALFSPVETKGSETINAIRRGFTELIAEQRADLAKIVGEGSTGDRVRSAAEKARADAEAKAQAKASEIAQEQVAAEIMAGLFAKSAGDVEEAEGKKRDALDKTKQLQDEIARSIAAAQRNQIGEFYAVYEAAVEANRQFAAEQDTTGATREAQFQEMQRRKIAVIQKTLDEGLIATDQAQEAIAEIERESNNHSLQMTKETEQRRLMYRQAALDGTAGILNNLATLQQSHNKTAQKVGKAAAKASIVVNTADAAMKSYNAMAGIPYVGPYLGALAAAAAIAAGVVQLQNVDKGTIGTSGSASTAITADSAKDSGGDGGGSGRGRNTQTLVVQGDYLTPETLARIFAEARERGITIDGVRRA